MGLNVDGIEYTDDDFSNAKFINSSIETAEYSVIGTESINTNSDSTAITKIRSPIRDNDDNKLIILRSLLNIRKSGVMTIGEEYLTSNMMYCIDKSLRFDSHSIEDKFYKVVLDAFNKGSFIDCETAANILAQSLESYDLITAISKSLVLTTPKVSFDFRFIVDGHLEAMNLQDLNAGIMNVNRVGSSFSAKLEGYRALFDTFKADTEMPYFPDSENQPFNRQPLLTYNDIPLLTRGGIATIVAKSGVGKSNIMSAFASGRLNPDCDTFGFQTIQEGVVYYLETEMPQASVWDLWKRCIDRAGVSGSEPNVRIGSLRQLSRKARISYIHNLFRSVPGLSMVIIDGFADLISNVNDPTETSEVSDQLLMLADKFNIGILTSIHENPTSSSDKKNGGGGKPRGHVGSELLRRSDTVLQISTVPDTDGKVSKIAADFDYGKIRYGLKDLKAYFGWSADKGMFVSMDPTSLKPMLPSEVKKSDLIDHLRSHGKSDRSEMVQFIMEFRGISNESASKQFYRLKCDGLLVEIDGLWSVKSENYMYDIDFASFPVDRTVPKTNENF